MILRTDKVDLIIDINKQLYQIYKQTFTLVKVMYTNAKSNIFPYILSMHMYAKNH